LELTEKRALIMKNLLVILSVVLLGLVTLNAVAKDKKEIPEYTVEGLKLVPDTKDVALVWAEPGATLNQYNRVYLVEPYVAFRKDWKRDQNRGSAIRVRTSDMERIKEGVKELFIEVFTEELEKGGYQLVTERAEDVLIVKPAIIDLDVYAPDIMTANRSASFSDSAGAMTLYMELYDSETDDLLAKVLDHKSDHGSGFMQWATGPSNRAAGKRLMRPWAEALRKAFDRAHETTSEK
jgi:hypothetical protein